VTDLDLKDRAGGAVVESTAEKPGIFISYARSDSSVLAEELVAGLELAGFRPFWIGTTLLPPKTGRRGSAR
jgi:hypothetical protein